MILWYVLLLLLQADFCNMEQIEDNSIDGLYALESTCHSSDPLNVYKEVYRVLKPGALFVDSAWVMTDKYQPGNPVHEKIKHDIVVSVTRMFSIYINYNDYNNYCI